MPDKRESDGTTVTAFLYMGCNPEVRLYKINAGGHTWPGGTQYLGEKTIGKTCRDINACDEIWEFFSAF